MRKNIWSFFCAILVAVSSVAQLALPARAETSAEDISLYATAAVLMDADSGRVLYGKNADTPLAMASTTKIMTCITILENVSLDETLTVSAYAAGMPKVKLYIQKGEQYTVKDLLYSLMLESHNDSAMALAEHVGKRFLPEELKNKDTSEYTTGESRQAMAAFAALMNERAAKLGCEKTWFITPNGLDETQEVTLEDGSVVQREHCTTAEELAKIMSYCLKGSTCTEEFLRITRTQSYSFTANGRSFTCNNHNSFLGMMDGALTGKTGFTNKAGYCYVGALERDGRTFVVALLACGWPNNKNYKWSDTRELMQYGIDNYFYRSFLEEDIAFEPELLSPIPVRGGRTRRLGGTAYASLTVLGGEDSPGGSAALSGEADAEGLLMREDEDIKVEYSVKSALTAPVKAGTEVGIVEYSVGGVVYRREKILTKEAVEEIDLEWCAEQILKRFLLNPAR